MSYHGLGLVASSISDRISSGTVSISSATPSFTMPLVTMQKIIPQPIPDVSPIPIKEILRPSSHVAPAATPAASGIEDTVKYIPPFNTFDAPAANLMESTYRSDKQYTIAAPLPGAAASMAPTLQQSYFNQGGGSGDSGGSLPLLETKKDNTMVMIAAGVGLVALLLMK